MTIYRWVLRFTPLLAEAAGPCRHAVGSRWQVDETYVKVAGRGGMCTARSTSSGRSSTCSSRRRDEAAPRFFQRAIGTTKVAAARGHDRPALTYPAVLEELLPAAWHRTERYANNHIEADHGRLKARPGPMRGLKKDRSAR